MQRWYICSCLSVQLQQRMVMRGCLILGTLLVLAQQLQAEGGDEGIQAVVDIMARPRATPEDTSLATMMNRIRMMRMVVMGIGQYSYYIILEEAIQ